jgi:hypothetical protein
MSTIQLLISLIVVGAAGFCFGKFKFFDEAARKALIKFVFYVATSALLLEAVLSINIHSVGKFARFTFANVVVACGLYVLTYIILRISRVGYKSGASILYAGNVANNIYIGLPLIRALYGTQGLVYAVVFLAIPLTISDVVDFYVLSHWKNNESGFKSVLKELYKNPIVISIAVGVVLLILGVKLPQSINSGLNLLGETASGLALFAMGLYISKTSWRRFKVRAASITSIIKLLVIPALTYVVMKYVFHLTGIALDISVIMAAFPSAIFCMVVASEFQFDEGATADSIVLSTILFVFTSLLWTHYLK